MKRILFFLILIPLFARAQINADGVLNIGRNALYYEDYALAIQYFNQVIDSKPYLYEPYYYRAVAKYYLGDYPGTTEDCSSAIERDPFIDGIYRLRAISLIMTADYDKALSDYRWLIHHKADDRDIWYNMVLCEAQLKSLDKADALLDTMITRWPSYARCYTLKAQIALEKKDTLSADTLLDRTLVINPFDVDALSAKAMLCLQKSNWQSAIDAYDKAIIQSPKEAGFYINRAMARYQIHNLRGAMDDYSTALDIEQDNYLGHYNRGLLRMQVGEDNLAIEDFNFVLKKEPTDRLALFNRALLLEKTGNYRAAIRDYTTVLRQYPDFLYGYESRAKCRRRIGDNKNALLDERKVYIARLDEMFGTKKKNRRNTRKQKEHNIDDYKKLVVDDDEDHIAKFYASDYRGKVQNRDVAIELQPLFILTFNKMKNGIANDANYVTFVEKMNNEQWFNQRLYLSSREASADASDIQNMNRETTRLGKRLEKDHKDARLLFQHAMYLQSERDYATAESELNQAIDINRNLVALYFLRAVVKAKQAETATLKQGGKNSTAAPSAETLHINYTPIIQDFTKAIALDSTCSYLYYNRGCIYARLKDTNHAIEDFDHAIALNPTLAEAYYNRGLLFIEDNDETHGFTDLGKAGELGLYSAYSLIKHFRKAQSENKK